MPKILHSTRRPQGSRAGDEPARGRREGDTGPQGPHVVLEKKWGAPDHEGGVSIAKEMSSRTRTRRSVPSSSKRSQRRPMTLPVTAPRPQRFCKAMVRKGSATLPPAPPDSSEEGIEKAVEKGRSRPSKLGSRRRGRDQIAQVVRFREQRPEIGETTPRRWTGPVRTGSSPVEGEQHLRSRARARRGYALRQGLHLSVLHHRCRAHGSRSGGPYVLIANSKISAVKDLLPIREGHTGRQVVLIVAEMSRARPSRHSSSTDPRHVQGPLRSGSRVR